MKTATSPKRQLGVALFNLMSVVVVFLVLPRFNIAVMLTGCAILATIQVQLSPDIFRSRSGSLSLAIWGLLAPMWIAALVAIAVTLRALPS
ncbi:MAG TPA: hypothetical protein VHD62_18050 [Opitutaceae bacterium]|nr:hypothetical protein [Opitutaceae bacterium]